MAPVAVSLPPSDGFPASTNGKHIYTTTKVAAMANVTSSIQPSLNGHYTNGSAVSNQPLWTPTEVKDSPKRTAFSFDSMEDALAAFAAGEFLVVMDDENRENEGDLIIAANQCTTEKMAWMIKHTRYVYSCVPHAVHIC